MTSRDCSQQDERLEPHEAYDIGFKDFEQYGEPRHREEMPIRLLPDYALGYEKAKEHDQ